MIEIIDITMPLSEGTTCWPTNKPPEFPAQFRMAQGDAANVTDCAMCTHTGTHVDAPFHHHAKGKTIGELPADRFCGIAYVLELPAPEISITAADLTPLDDAEPFDILLVKTRNSIEKDIWDGTFREDYIFLSPDGARDLIRRGIKGFGIDCLSVESYAAAVAETHKVLMDNDTVAIIEGVDLRNVASGRYLLFCLPLRIEGSDGAPARAILIKDPTGALLETWERGKE